MPNVQIAEAKEAGAAGIIGVIVNVLGKSVSPTMYRYAQAAGLDAPLEVRHHLCC